MRHPDHWSVHPERGVQAHESEPWQAPDAVSYLLNRTEPSFSLAHVSRRYEEDEQTVPGHEFEIIHTVLP